jgi:hypothetical protein
LIQSSRDKRKERGGTLQEKKHDEVEEKEKIGQASKQAGRQAG